MLTKWKILDFDLSTLLKLNHLDSRVMPLGFEMEVVDNNSASKLLNIRCNGFKNRE